MFVCIIMENYPQGDLSRSSGRHKGLRNSPYIHFQYQIYQNMHIRRLEFISSLILSPAIVQNNKTAAGQTETC